MMTTICGITTQAQPHYGYAHAYGSGVRYIRAHLATLPGRVVIVGLQVRYSVAPPAAATPGGNKYPCSIERALTAWCDIVVWAFCWFWFAVLFVVGSCPATFPTSTFPACRCSLTFCDIVLMGLGSPHLNNWMVSATRGARALCPGNARHRQTRYLAFLYRYSTIPLLPQHFHCRLLRHHDALAYCHTTLLAFLPTTLRREFLPLCLPATSNTVRMTSFYPV